MSDDESTTTVAYFFANAFNDNEDLSDGSTHVEQSREDKDGRVSDLLNEDRDYSETFQLLRSSGRSISYFMRPATLENLRIVSTPSNPESSNVSVVHISCHATHDVLELEQSTSMTCDRVTRPRLRDALSGDGAIASAMENRALANGQAPPASRKGCVPYKLAVLLVCHGAAFAQTFLDAGAEVVVTVHQDYEINDKVAVNFATSFYGYLIKNGISVRAAFNKAQGALPKSEGNKFVLLECKVNHAASLHLFNRISAKEPPVSLDAPIVQSTSRPRLIGRDTDMKLITSELHSAGQNGATTNQVMVLTGGAGVGKATLV